VPPGWGGGHPSGAKNRTDFAFIKVASRFADATDVMRAR
jgi:hypothetical protein